MNRMRGGPASRPWPFPFALALALVALAFARGCGSPALAPFPGAPEALETDFVALPVGELNVAGGNFLLARTDLAIDTRLGTQAFGATWNSATGAWRWSTELSYDGASFVDAGGATHDASSVASGHAIPGTHWRVLDASRLATKGGLVHRFGSDGLLEEVHWSGDAYPSLRFLYTAPGGARRLVTVEQCTANTSCATVFDLAYDAAGRLARVTDRAGRVADYAYDASGRLVAARDPVATATSGPGIRYEYTGGQISAVTSGDGERVALAYAGRRLASLTQEGEEEPVWKVAYGPPDADGHYVTELTDPLGDKTRFLYDAAGELLERTHPSGARESFAWSGGRIVSSTDAHGAVTSIRYLDDDPVEITMPSGNIVAVSYRSDAENRLAPTRTAVDTVSDSLGLILRQTYDSAGRLAAITNGAGETRSFTYDGLGELATMTSPSGATITYGGYGEHGHPTILSSPFVSATAVYDAVGDLLQGSSQAPDFGTAPGGVVSRSYDEDRRLRQELLVDQPPTAAPTTGILRIDRRADGRPLAVHRPYGGDTEFVYDAIGRLVARRERVDGAWQTTAITRDALGRPVSVVQPNGMELDRTWNADGQLAGVSRSRHGTLEASASYTYAGGLLESIQDSVDGGTERYERDAAGRITAIHHASGETLLLQVDSRGRTSRETFWMPGSVTPLRTLDFTYDGANRRVGILDGGTPIVTHTFGQGRVARIDYGNGLSRTYGYDPTSSYVDDLETRDPSGGLVESTRIYWSIAYGRLWVKQYQNLPVMAVRDDYVVAPTTTQAGDESGGRESSDQDDTSFGYDALSNVTDGGVTPQLRHFVYNAEHNRLLSILDSSGSPIHSYAYDAAGFATQRDGVDLGWTADGRLSRLGASVQVTWDLEGRIVSLDVQGQTTRFLFGGRVQADASGTPRKLVLSEVEIDLKSGRRRYRHFDFRGNVAFVTDSGGSVVQAYDYGAFGVRASYGPVQGERSFAQGRLLGDVVLMGSRLYDPDAARFLAPDPVYQTVNQFAYAMGNPVEFWDPGATSMGSNVGMAIGAAVVMFSAAADQPAGAALGAGIIAGAAVPVQSPATNTAVSVAAFAAGRFGGPVGELIGAAVVGYDIGQAIEDAIDTAHGGNPRAAVPTPTGPLSPQITPLPPGHPAAGGGSGGAGAGGGSSGGRGAGPGGGGPGLAFGSSAPGVEVGCTATALRGAAPSLAWLWLLGPLQVGLGAWLLRARRQRGPGPQ